jgi:phosphatidylglycerophosphate synthase
MNIQKQGANIITCLRIVLACIMIFTSPFSISFAVLYSLCGLSDMIDGFVARKLHMESEFGAKLDSVADLVFVVVVLLKVLPELELSMWLLVWIVLIGIGKVSIVLYGYYVHKKLIMLHTLANKTTGFCLFLLPLTGVFVDISLAAVPVCLLATFAAVQEGYFIIKK